MHRLLTAAILLALVHTPLAAQTADEWVDRGHRAAQSDRHADAIAAYERAIELQPQLRPALLASLGRQYLWSDNAPRAAELLREYLRSNDECDVRADFGLALAWSEQFREAQAVLVRLLADCNAFAGSARLRLAMIRRWQDQPTEAVRLYREVLQVGSAEEVRAARTGLAYAWLLQDYNRRALRAFTDLARTAATPEDRYAAGEGMAVALARLGRHDAARQLLEEQDTISADLRDVSAAIEFHASPQVAPHSRAFRDGDGTTFGSAGAAITGAPAGGARAGVDVSHWSLDGGTSHHSAVETAILGEWRWGAAIAGSGRAARSFFREGGWSPYTGELNVAVTPGDAVRVDVSLARIMARDNAAALDHQLTGRHAAVSTDVRITPAVTLMAAADLVQWSTGNRRARLRGSARLQFEGMPRLTLELPALLQTYDEAMPFAFFSPEQYIEAGPGANLHTRFSDHWNASVHGRLGLQRESGQPWNVFGTARAAVWRDAIGDWSVNAALSWSNSSLASPTSFQRTAVELTAIRAL